MLDHLNNIYSNWNNNYGDFGAFLKNYLDKNEVSIEEYDILVNSFLKKYPNVTYADWFLPSLVEKLVDWEYEEYKIHKIITKSLQPKLWESLFPYAFTHLDTLDLASSVRWETFVKKWSDYLQIDFYQHIDYIVAQAFVKIEIGLPPNKINSIRYLTCLKTAKYTPKDNLEGRPWKYVYDQLCKYDWSLPEDKQIFQQLALEWIKHSNMVDSKNYLEKATFLLKHKHINWSIEALQNVICRYRNIDEDGSNILDEWIKLNSSEYPNWNYIFEYQQNWNEDKIHELLTDNYLDTNSIRTVSNIIFNQPYTERLKKEILTYKCLNNLIDEYDVLNSNTWSIERRNILVFWICYRKDNLDKKFIKPVMDIYEFHPNYQKDQLLKTYLPGFHKVKNILVSMDLNWSQSLHYMESAMKIHSELQQNESSLHINPNLFTQ